MIKRNKFRKICICTLISCLVLIWSLIPTPDALALNAQGNKASNFQGYRHLNDHQIQVWVDKNSPVESAAQFKVFEGTGTDGRQLAIESVVSGSGSNVTGVSGLSGAASFVITTAANDAFVPGKIYTVVLNNTIKSNNGLTLGNFYFHKDILFSFAVPNADGTYSNSIPVTFHSRPENNATGVPFEGNIWFSLDVPVSNYDAVKSGMVLRKDGVPLVLDPTIDSSSNGDIYAPLVTDDHTFFFFPMTGGGSAYSYNLSPHAEYTLEIPEIQTVNGQTIPAQTLTFHTANEIIPTKIIGAPTVTPSGDSLMVTWPASTEIRDAYNKLVSPAASGYNIYASTDRYWNYTKLNDSPVTETSYTPSGLTPNTTYYFRVTPVNDGGEAGFSDSALGTTPPDTNVPTWPNGKLDYSHLGSTSLTLKWSAATDNAQVVSYRVYQGETLLGSTDGNTTTYSVSGLTASTQYTFKVEAGDAAGNWSTDGPSVTVQTNDSVPVTTGTVDVAEDNRDLAITGETPDVVISVPSNITNATIDVGAMLNLPQDETVTTDPLPEITIKATAALSASPIQVTIPAKTTVSAPAAVNWNGTINVPTIKPNNTVVVTPDAGKTASVNAVIEVGYGDIPLTLSKAVKIIIPGQAGKDAGYYRGSTFTKITRICAQDDQAWADTNIPAGEDGRIDVGSDLVIWTKHFTKFVTYTQTAIPHDGGSVSGDSTAPTWPAGSTLTGSKTSQTEADLTWTAATDNVGVTGYRIYVDGTLVANVNGSATTYKVTGLTQGTAHTFKVEAGDAAGNWTTNGPSVTIGGSGDKPLNFSGAYLTTVSGNSSTTGDAVEGSSSVPTRPTIKMVFDKNVVNDAVWGCNQGCFCLQDSSGVSVSINVTRISDLVNFDERQNIFITPLSDLIAGKSYKIVISKNLTAKNGNTLGETTGNKDLEVCFTVTSPTVNLPVLSTNGSTTVEPSVGGTIRLSNLAEVQIPANALNESAATVVKVDKVTSPPAVPTDTKLASEVFEFTVGGKTKYTFNGNVTLKFAFNTAAIGADEIAAVHYYDESQDKWVLLGGTVSGSTITVQVDHFTQFAVLAVKKPAEVPVINKPAVVFKDIAGHWATNSINKLAALGAIGGYSDGTFRPNVVITRAEFASILVRAFKLETKSGKIFNDTVNHWAKNCIATAAAYGIISGYNDQLFGPNDPITREQMAVMVVRAAKLAPATGEITFKDSTRISPWARRAVIAAVKNGIIRGFSDSTIRPWNNASRAEAVAIVANALK